MHSFPPSLKQLFIEEGYDCIHTLDLELGNATTDKIINKLSIEQNLVVVTKDGDFYDSFIVKREPYKLILVKLGNASKKELIEFFEQQFGRIIKRIKTEDLVLLRKEIG